MHERDSLTMDKIDQLRNLVSIFHENHAQYKSSQYDEANTRTDFIDKFFALLDWDVANSQGFSESYREVMREDNTSSILISKFSKIWLQFQSQII